MSAANTPSAALSSASNVRKQSSKTVAKSAPVPHASSGLLGSRPGSRRAPIACFVAGAMRSERDAGALREVDEHLALAARVVDGDERSGARAAAGGEQKQGAGELVRASRHG